MPLCADEGVQTIVYSPLARGRLARPWGEMTARTMAEAAYAHELEATAASDRQIIDAVGAIAAVAIKLSDEEASRLEAPYTPRRDHQGVSDPAILGRAARAATGFAAGVA